MNTESFRGYREKMLIFDDCIINQKALEESIESLRKLLHIEKETIKIVGDILFIKN